MPSYGLDYQLIKANSVKVLKCRVCGKVMQVRRGVYSGDSIMATLLGKSGIFDEFCCKNSGEEWHETILESIKYEESQLIENIRNRRQLSNKSY